jgi:hypothetical protein
MAGQVRLDRGWENRHTILVALGGAYHDLIRAEIDVLHAKATALENPQAGPIEQERHQAWYTAQGTQNRSDFVARENDRKP